MFKLLRFSNRSQNDHRELVFYIYSNTTTLGFTICMKNIVTIYANIFVSNIFFYARFQKA